MDRLQRLFVVCIFVRCLIASLFLLLAWAVDTMEKGRMVRVALIFSSVFSFSVSVGFVSQMALQRQFGRFGGKIWWKRMRYIHAVMWFLSGCFALLPRITWWLRGLPAVADVTVGTIAGFLHYKYS